MIFRTTYLILFLFTGIFLLQAQPPKQVELAKPFSYDAPLDTNLQKLPAAGQTIGPFELLSVQPALSGEKNLYTLTWVAYQAGRYSLPVSLESPPDTSNVYVIEVTEPAPDQIGDYLPPKEILFPKPAPSKSWLFPILSTLAILAAGIYYWLRKKPKKQIPLKAEKEDIDLLIAGLKKDWQTGHITPEKLGEDLKKIMLSYFNLSDEKSHYQFFQSVKPLLNQASFISIRKIYDVCDGWQFGKKNPTTASGVQTIEAFERIIHPPVEPSKHPS